MIFRFPNPVPPCKILLAFYCDSKTNIHATRYSNELEFTGKQVFMGFLDDVTHHYMFMYVKRMENCLIVK